MSCSDFDGRNISEYDLCGALLFVWIGAEWAGGEGAALKVALVSWKGLGLASVGGGKICCGVSRYLRHLGT